MIYHDPTPPAVEGWYCIYETANEQEIGLVKTFLEGQGITTQLMSKKDSGFNLGVGDMAVLFLFVPNDQKIEADACMEDWVSGNLELDDDQDPDA